MAREGCRTSHRPPGGAAGLVSAGSPAAISIAVGPIAVVCQGITYRTERTTLTATVVPVETLPPREPAELDQETLSLAAKVFQLLTALDPGQRWRKAQPITVFLKHYREGLSRSQIARECGCDKSLVSRRLKAIHKKLSWEPRQLRELSAHVEAMQEAVRDSRARRIRGRTAVCGEEEREEQFD